MLVRWENFKVLLLLENIFFLGITLFPMKRLRFWHRTNYKPFKIKKYFDLIKKYVAIILKVHEDSCLFIKIQVCVYVGCRTLILSKQL